MLGADGGPHVASGDLKSDRRKQLQRLYASANTNMSAKLFVGNLAFETTQSDLEELFSTAGSVREAIVITDRESGRSRGFGFVTMSTTDEAREAVRKFNGHTLQSRPLKVNEAQERSEAQRPAWRR